MSTGGGVTRSIVPVVIYAKNGNSIDTYALLDPGATRSVINEKIVNDLNLPIEIKNMRVITVDSIKEGSRNLTSFKLGNLKGDYSFDVPNALVGNILTLENDIPPSKKDIDGFSHLEGIEFDELPNKDIGLLLSAEFAWSWTGGECRRGAPHEPIAFLTCYGWATVGCNRSSTSNVVSHYRLDGDDLEVRKDVKVFDGNKEDTSINEYKCSSVKYDKELAYRRVGGPWDYSMDYDSDSYIF